MNKVKKILTPLCERPDEETKAGSLNDAYRKLTFVFNFDALKKEEEMV